MSATLDSAIPPKLPTISLLKQTVRRTWKDAGRTPTSPTNIVDLNVEGDYRLTAKGEPFLLFDSGPVPDRILIFSTTENLKMLEESEHWFADGIFKSSPTIFYQLYTIHCIQYNAVIPTVFALLPNKSEQTYKKLLKALLELNPSLCPKSIMTDFEIAQKNAFQSVFGDIEHHGCFFHFNQCIWRVIQANPMIRTKYEAIDDPSFSLNVKKLAALAFAPVQDVAKLFEQLMESSFYKSNEEMLEPLTSYFERTWIGSIRTLATPSRRRASFGVGIWNCYDSCLNNLPKTNNSVEGWNHKFSRLLGGHNPTIWKLIDGLKWNRAPWNSTLLSLQPVLHLRHHWRNTRKWLNVLSKLFSAIENAQRKII